VDRLELRWIGKDQRPRLEPRILIEESAISYHASMRREGDQFDNVLIHGDNLLALKALESTHTAQVKCIYIDPPYNTGSAFTHYDDGLEHSHWLGLMRDRLEILKKLLRDDGVIFVHIDDTEQAYLKVLMDEIFGRKNFCGQFVWEKKKKPSFLNSNMGVVTEYIMAYSPDRRRSPPFIGGKTTEGKKYPVNNAGNSPSILTFPANSVVFRCSDQVFDPQDMSEGNIKTRLLDQLTIKNGRNAGIFRLWGEWRYSQKKLDEILANGETIVISKAPFRPNHIKAGGEDKKLKNLLSIAHYGVPTYEDSNAESTKIFGSDAFDYPKPEGLIKLLLDAVTEPGDLVLDSFAGSGTTGAVAHKMRRKWIMVELGEHCRTHIVPRLRKVIDGTDQGGISTEVGWAGGGGFRYFHLAPSLLEKDQFGNWVISKAYNAEMLAEAMCKHFDFKYAPSAEHYWIHGHSSETDFIYVTTSSLSHDQLRALSDEVGSDRTLLICCRAFQTPNASAFSNLTLRKIPGAILGSCEWGKDDYSLKIENLPMMEESVDEANQATEIPTISSGIPDLFAEDSTKLSAVSTNGTDLRL
jgi:adenine-specific DNA-methyltransferase